MSYFPDLSDYTYSHVRASDTKNVGWLDSQYEFAKGSVSDAVKETLWRFCTVSVEQTRGIHPCSLCADVELARYPVADRNGERLLLGSAEIRVFGADTLVYAAPTLIYHYVVEHSYLPPVPFIEALQAGPAPPSAEYFDRLSRVGLEWRPTLKPSPVRRRWPPP